VVMLVCSVVEVFTAVEKGKVSVVRTLGVGCALVSIAHLVYSSEGRH
jgi:hypothetical protein